jgi:hypothetical protein
LFLIQIVLFNTFSPAADPQVAVADSFPAGGPIAIVVHRQRRRKCQERRSGKSHGDGLRRQRQRQEPQQLDDGGFLKELELIELIVVQLQSSKKVDVSLSRTKKE